MLSKTFIAFLALAPSLTLARPVHPAERQLGGGLGGLVGNVLSTVGDVLDPITASIGLDLNLDIGQSLTCNNVNGTFGGRDYNLGCTCQDSTGGLLLEVDVDAVVNVDGLEAWIAAQVNSPWRKLYGTWLI